MAFASDVATAARPRLPAGWLSAEDAASARPLRAWPLERQQALAAAIAAATREWAAQWGAAGTFDVRPDNPDDDGGHWQDVAAATGADLRWRLAGTTTVRQALLAALFGERGASATDDRLADALVERAWQDWCGRMTAVFPVAAAPFETSTQPFDGSLRLRLDWLGGELSLAVGGELVACWIATHGAGAPRAPVARSRPAALLQAVGEQAIAVRVELGRIDVNLGDLLALRAGDIFCTGHLLETPLAVRAADTGEQLCAAQLGARDGWLAIELQPDSAHS